MLNLTKFDYEILDFVNSFAHVTEEQIFEKFPERDYSTRERLMQLSTPKYSEWRNCPSGETRNVIPNSQYIDYELDDATPMCRRLDRVFITPLGRKEIQDYHYYQSVEEKKFNETIVIAKESNKIARETADVSAKSNKIALAAVVVSVFALLFTLYVNKATFM